MREVTIYTRKEDTKGFDETSFKLPTYSIRPPQGNAALSKIEAEFQAYQEQRIIEAEELFEQERDGDDSASTDATPTMTRSLPKQEIDLELN